jgi:8-oxo-dGTP diphosphatase
MALSIRPAVRALLLDEGDHILLARFEFPTATVWALPGGGLESDEDPTEGLKRELHEELGLDDPEIGPHIWTRLHIIPMNTGHDGQRDHIHLVRIARFEPVPTIGWDRLRAELVHEMRWWSLTEIEQARHTTLFAPRNLAQLTRTLLRVGPPTTPIETGV